MILPEVLSKVDLDEFAKFILTFITFIETKKVGFRSPHGGPGGAYSVPQPTPNYLYLMHTRFESGL
jgi:hypothetical protein